MERTTRDERDQQAARDTTRKEAPEGTSGAEAAGERFGWQRQRYAEVVDVHLILRRGGDVLLARRSGTGYADGLLNAPSGHLEPGEDVREAVIREASEEIGVRLSPGELSVALVMQHRAPDATAARTGWFFTAEYEPGRLPEPFNREPAKCSELAWYPLDALPADMVAYCRAGLDAYRAGERFVLHLHRPGDPIAHDPAAPSRATALPAAARPGPPSGPLPGKDPAPIPARTAAPDS
jgi:8-oxo-dGTP pyrophosphatase MutT (NUDIX family)